MEKASIAHDRRGLTDSAVGKIRGDHEGTLKSRVQTLTTRANVPPDTCYNSLISVEKFREVLLLSNQDYQLNKALHRFPQASRETP